MLALTATTTAREQLRRLRESNPALFDLVGARISAVRSDPAGSNAGRSFRLDDGGLARLILFYDHLSGDDLVLVWVLDGEAMKIVAVEHASSQD